MDYLGAIYGLSRGYILTIQGLYMDYPGAIYGLSRGHIPALGPTTLSTAAATASRQARALISASRCVLNFICAYVACKVTHTCVGVKVEEPGCEVPSSFSRRAK